MEVRALWLRTTWAALPANPAWAVIGTDLCFVVRGLKGSGAGLASPLLHSLGYVVLGGICWIELSHSSEVLQGQHVGGPERANNEGRFSPIDPCLPVKPLGQGPGRDSSQG